MVLDAAKFEQVLNNLIGNAVKFSHPGSKIDIRLIDEGPTILLAVQDYGLGMDERELAQLFEPLARGRAGTRGEKSTGLGLLIVKRIVAGHRGQIDIHSKTGGRYHVFGSHTSWHRDPLVGGTNDQRNGSPLGCR